MNGSAKQIAWANEIRNRMLRGCEAVRTEYLNDNPAPEKVQRAMSIIDAAIASINEEQEAKWFIDNRDAWIDVSWVKKIAKSRARQTWSGTNGFNSIR